MSWTAAAALAVSVGSQVLGSSASKAASEKQAKAQLEAERYNATAQYGTTLNNIKLRTAVVNANLKNLLTSTELAQTTNNITTEFNASLLTDVAMYNDKIYANDIENVWAQAGLDTEVLSQQRGRERGSMIASQGASGTVIGTGSNADAVVDHMTQEALDAFIIKTGAADKAASITNARMQSLYQARQEVSKLEFEGAMKNTVNNASALMQGQSILTENALQTATDLTNAQTQLQTGLAGAQANLETNKIQINNNFTTGMFGALNTAVQGASSLYTSSMSAKTA